MRFEFATANRIVFGPGTAKEAAPIAGSLGERALLVTGREPGRAGWLATELGSHGVAAVTFPISGEPGVSDVETGIAAAKRYACDLVIALGGGSAIDAGKAIAAMLANEGDLLDYLEVIGRGKTLAKASLPFIAIPTTAGTGSEVTRNAVLASPEHHVKVSLRSSFMLPSVAIVDPELTYGLPPAVTASTGLDALTQVIEPYVSSRANPMVDALCVEGIRRAGRSLRLVCEPGSNPAARVDMSVASLFGGLALANAGLGAVHGFAGPIGGAFSAPHGAICAALLPHVMHANIAALRQRQPDSDVLRRYDEVGRLLTRSMQGDAEGGVRFVQELVSALHIPALGAYGITRGHLADLVDKSAKASSMKANPIVLTREELHAILEASL